MAEARQDRKGLLGRALETRERRRDATEAVGVFGGQDLGQRGSATEFRDRPTPRGSHALSRLHARQPTRPTSRPSQPVDKAGFKIVPLAGDDPVDEATVRSAFETYLAASDAIVLVANQNSELWPKGQEGGPLGLQLELAKQYRIPVHLWLQTKDFSTVRNQQYRSFLANVEANARGDADTLIHAEDIDAFARYVSGKLDTAPKPSKGAEQLAVVCSNARVGQAKCDELQHIVTEALQEAEIPSIILGREEDSGQIRLKPLEEDISGADAVVVVLCFDQEWVGPAGSPRSLDRRW